MSSPTPGSPTTTALEWTADGSRAVDLIRALAMDAMQEPAGLGLSRQNLPVLDRGESSQNGLASADGAARGGYILAEGTNGEPAVILIGTGSEVQIALAARDILQGEGIPARVLFPCRAWNGSRPRMLLSTGGTAATDPRASASRQTSQPGHAFATDLGECVSLEHYGVSAAYQTLYEEFGFTAEHAAAAARSSLARLDANARSEDS